MVRNAIDCPEAMDRALKGLRLGVVTGGAAVSRELVPTLDILHERYRVTRLFNTIYGVRSEYVYGERVEHYVDDPTGLPVTSIFNRQRLAPEADMLTDVDMLVFDIREAGVRYYEYLACLGNLMKAAARFGKPVTVLDRIDPIGGLACEGTVCPPEMHTIVGDYGLPNRTALTIGEFARYINGEYHLGCELTVVPTEGWKRAMDMDDIGLPYVLPSPSLPTVTSNLLYAGMCIFEGVSTVSEGRGTTKPFELIGAPWLDAAAVTEKMRRLGLPGVAFGSTYFIPNASKHKGQVCQGVQLHVRSRGEFLPVATALALLDTLREMYPREIAWADCSAGHEVLELPSMQFDRYVDKLLADKDYSAGQVDGEQLLARHAPALEQYRRKIQQYWLYE